MISVMIMCVCVYVLYIYIHIEIVYNLKNKKTRRGQLSPALVAKLLPVPSATGQVPIRMSFLNAFRNSGLNIV